MDKVIIRNLKAEAIIGIYDFERVAKQPVIISLEMAWDNKKPASTEDIADALDYEKVSKSVKALIESSSFQLVETLAETIAEHVLMTYHTQSLYLELKKPNAIDFTDYVGLSMTRTRADYQPR
ncbi:dihydroneopterin aldolase [Wohlfahrtiimonas chitiniclastica]|uniref:dihydroneopterin aldolase n=1 Tax=Wohlfahrtiimonas chitiniclastica TaxID=400946 RepID=UPI00035F4E6C|nr:dihydroneopterin aldolase [Wohlfahrtiimonas chitiniclastica]